MEDKRGNDSGERFSKRLCGLKPTPTSAKPKDSPLKSKHKHKLDPITASELLSPLKRLKIEQRTPIILSQASSTSTEDTDVIIVSQMSKSGHFIQACKEVLSKEFNDVGWRLNMTLLPDCCLDTDLCHKIHQNKVELLSELSYEPFRIDMQAGMWIEALNVCRSALKCNNYPSIKMMQNIMKIILNLHEDTFKSYSLPFVLQKCQSTFKLFLSTHPPCMSVIRKTYLSFLTMPFKWDSMFQDKEDLGDKCGLFEFILNRLEIELADDSPDGPITDLPEFDSKHSSMDLTEAHRLKNQYETHQNLSRRDRIVRLFMVLDLIVHLLERDLSIWMSRYILNLRKYMMGRHKPLIASIIWHQNDLLTGTINRDSKVIFQLLVNVIKLQFPSHTINAVSRLFNLVSYAFYSCDENIADVYPTIGKYCTAFGENMYKVMEDENIDIILEVATQVKTKYMKYFLTSIALKRIMKSEEEVFLNLVLHIFEKSAWESFSKSNLQPSSTRNAKIANSEFTMRLDSLFVNAPDKNLVKKKYRKPTVYKHLVDTFKDGSRNGKRKICNVKFLLLFYHSFKYYLELYNIENIRVLYVQKINEEIKEKPILNPIFIMNDHMYDLRLDFNRASPAADDVRFCSYWTHECTKHYRNIFQHLKQIGIVYSHVKLKYPWINYFFQNINAIQNIPDNIT
ncbi:uncharacterized protein LOC143920962 [Arctopsyche grandis]|uniref:uncharacterized protein LOC143920962 n=1 Tax=Arctopsyche grandis TaxID=121162 RepID=UPI00406DA204